METMTKIMAIKAPSYFVGEAPKYKLKVLYNNTEEEVKTQVLLYYNGTYITEFCKIYNSGKADTILGRIDFRITRLYPDQFGAFWTEKSWLDNKTTKEMFMDYLEVFLKEKAEFEKEALMIE